MEKDISFHCCFSECQFPQILGSDGRVEVRTTIPKGGFSKLQKSKVKWKSNGDAIFHRDCWETLVKTSRIRNKKRATFVLSEVEKTLVKEALKTAEFHDSIDFVDNEASRIANLIKNSKHCVAFTGAGISTSAGIGDYRGKSGKWTEEDRETVNSDIPSPHQGASNELKQKKARTEDNSTPQVSNDDDSAVDNDDDDDDDDDDGSGVPYETLRPTYTHEALCKLVQLGLVKHIISQNGDGLHGLSGIPPKNLSELHGNVFVEKCEKCGTHYNRPFYVLDDHASLYYEELDDFGSTTLKKPRHAKQCKLCGLCHRTGRKCTKGKGCKGQLIDTIINFRDNLEDEIFSTAQEHARKCDLMLCLGTTMTVSPANELVEMGQHPLRIVVCNRQRTDVDKLCTSKDPSGRQLGSRVFGDCDTLISKVMGHLMRHNTLQEWERERDARMRQYDSKRSKT